MSFSVSAALSHSTQTNVSNAYQQASQPSGFLNNSAPSITAPAQSDTSSIGPAYSISLSSNSSYSALSSGISLSSLANSVKGAIKDQIIDIFSDLEFGGASAYGGIAGAGAANSNANPHPGIADSVQSTPMGAGGPYTGDQNVHSEPSNENNNDSNSDGDSDGDSDGED